MSVVDPKGAMTALAAAVLFGLSAPFAKLLLPGTGPLMLAALLYLGAGVGLTVVTLAAARRRTPDAPPRETPLRRADVPLLLVVIGSGGVAAPVLMLFGLARLSADGGRLLGDLETPF